MRVKGLMHELSPSLLTQGIYKKRSTQKGSTSTNGSTNTKATRQWNFWEKNNQKKIKISHVYLHMCHEHVSRLYLLTYSVKMQVQGILRFLSCFLDLTKHSINPHAACGIFLIMRWGSCKRGSFRACNFYSVPSASTFRLVYSSFAGSLYDYHSKLLSPFILFHLHGSYCMLILASVCIHTWCRKFSILNNVMHKSRSRTISQTVECQGLTNCFYVHAWQMRSFFFGPVCK